MKCCKCGKEIKINESHSLLGYDGDFIHDRCMNDFEKEQVIINNMSDEEFHNWLLSKKEI